MEAWKESAVMPEWKNAMLFFSSTHALANVGGQAEIPPSDPCFGVSRGSEG
jgi:hypothetical protein